MAKNRSVVSEKIITKRKKALVRTLLYFSAVALVVFLTCFFWELEWLASFHGTFKDPVLILVYNVPMFIVRGGTSLFLALFTGVLIPIKISTLLRKQGLFDI